MTQTSDAIVIDTGQSGPALAARLTKEGLKTAVIERKLFGVAQGTHRTGVSFFG